MSFEPVHRSKSQTPQSSWSTSQLARRPFPVQKPKRPPTQEDLENQAFRQNKFEAFGLQLKEKHGTITPVEQERLGMLQAKMDSFWAQRTERAKTQPNFLEIIIRNGQTAPATEPAATVQPKLTIGQPNDQYEQEADRVAERVMGMAPPVTPNIQRQTEGVSQVQADLEKPSLKTSSASKLIQLMAEQNYTPASEEFNHTPGEEEAADIGQRALQTVGYEKIIETALQAGFLREISGDESSNVQTKLQVNQNTIFRQAQAAMTAGQVFTRYAVAAGVASQLDSPAPGPGDVIAIGILIVGLAAAGYVLMSSRGTPKNNQAQNKQFADAVREIERRIGRRLSQDEIRRLHDAISGQDYGYHDIVEEGVGMFGS